MARKPRPKPRFDIGDWVARPVSGGRFIGRVIEYDTHLGTRPPSYGVFVYSDLNPPDFTFWSEPGLEPATPEEVATYSSLAATQEHPRIFRDPLGPRR